MFKVNLRNMKLKIGIIISTVLVILGLAVYGYFKAIPEASDEQSASNAATIEITPTNFNFGEIKYEDIVEHTFIIKNLGKKTLEINKIATSCGCTAAEATSENIAAGEEAELKVTYNTGAMTGSHAMGDQERIIYVKSNDPINPQLEVTINAYVN